MGIGFIGEIECKIDAKGRLLVPKAFQRQMPSEANDHLVAVSNTTGNCLVLYTAPKWKQVTEPFLALNAQREENVELVRRFLQYATPLDFDAQNRIMIPKRLMDFVRLKKDVILFGMIDRIELWDKQLHQQAMKTAGNRPFEEISQLYDGYTGGESPLVK